MSRLAQTQLPKDQPQIITTRLMAAPRELVWKVVTSPEHLKHCWGPDGFTNSYEKFDLRVGGQALFTMHGPDGTDYPNRFKFLKLDAPHYVKFDHDGGENDPDGHKFVGEIELTQQGANTLVELRLNEASMAARDAIAQFAAEGGRQNLDRIAAYLAPLAEKMNLFMIEREFPVPQQRLYEACTEIEQIRHWMAPAGAKVLVANRDFKPGGTYHYGMAMPNGTEMYGLQRYLEITPISRLVYTQSFADKHGNLAPHPMAPTWPMEMVSIFEFSSVGEMKSKLKISWINAGVDDAEGYTFRTAHDGMAGGWTGTLDSLQKYLIQR